MSDATDTPEVLEVADREGESAPRSAKAFWPSMLRLIGLMGSRKVGMFWVFGLLVICVGLSVYAPKVLGDAVDVIYDGVLARWSGDVAPGETAIDFGHLGTLIGVVLGMYLIASVFDWAQGFILNRIVVKVVLDLRSDVERKVHHLPLRYYDAQKKGDILSRTTNDIDNVQAALQQALASFVYSILMMLGVTVMMFTVSWQMALLALTVLPVTAGAGRHRRYEGAEAVCGAVGEHRQGQRACRGVLHRARPGRCLRSSGRYGQGLRRAQRGTVPGQCEGAVPVRHDDAADAVHELPQLRDHRRGRRAAGGKRQYEPGRGHRVHPVLP